MQRLPRKDSTSEYFLQVVAKEETPQWPKPAKELSVGSQILTSGFVQYWAYPKESNKYSDELPPAEQIAAQNPTPKPVIIINESSEADSSNALIELILDKDGHAWAKTETSLENMEDNLNSLVEFAKEKFDIVVEHFLTTDGVSPEVEKALDQIEGEETPNQDLPVKKESDLEALSEETAVPRRSSLGNMPQGAGSHYAPQRDIPNPQIGATGGSPKLVLLLPLILLVVAVAGVFVFKDKVAAKAATVKQLIVNRGVMPTPTQVPVPTQAPTPTPTPNIDRTKYTIRVLNGTLQSGAASTLGDSLKALGWKIQKVGNADDNNVAATVVHFKKGNDAVGAALVSDLGSKFTASASATLPISDKADAEVIIGKN